MPNALTDPLFHRDLRSNAADLGQGVLDYASGVGERMQQFGNDPVGYMGNALTQWGGNTFPTMQEMEDARSVMPSMREPYRRKMEALALGNMGMGGIFAGPKAYGANLNKLDDAKSMLVLGWPKERIRKDTGWFQGPEGGWRFEIPDVGARLKRPFDNSGVVRPGSEVIDHPNFFNAYPQAADLPTLVQRSNYDSGLFLPNQFIKVEAPTAEMALKNYLHEGQHLVQYAENFPRGGNPTSALSAVEKPVPLHYAPVEETMRLLRMTRGTDRNDLEQVLRHYSRNPVSSDLARRYIGRYDELENLIQGVKGVRGLTNDEAYRRLAGEAEARAVEARSQMTHEQLRQTPPRQSYDRPWEKLFYVYR